MDRDRYQRIVEAAGVGLAELDHAGVVVFANPRFVAMSGRAEPEVVGARLPDLVHEADREALESAVATVDVRFGVEERWVAVELTPIEGGRVAAITEVTERKRFERSLSDAADLFDAFMDASPVIGWMKDASGAYVYVNHALAAAYRCTRDQLLGKTAASLVGAELTAAVDEAEARVRATGVPEVTVVETGGGTIPKHVWQIVRFLFWDARGNRNIAGIGVDITAQHEAEAAIARIQEQLRQAQKMEAVGRLAGGIAHDFNNILTVILSCATLLRRSLPASGEMQADVAQIVKATERAAQLTRQLLSFSRLHILDPQVIDLDAVIDDTRSLLARLLGEDVELRFERAPSLGRVYADAASIGQVLMNLAVNARDAMPAGGTLTIATANAELDEAAARGLDVAPGAYVCLSVHDTGSGMDAATKARMFEPFFTTKAIGVGTGLGLSTVLGIVQESGGAITVDSEPGAGATFTIYLPVTQRPASARAQQAPALVRRGKETVLLVEDDTFVRDLASRVLAGEGYRVLEAGSADEALALVRRTADAAIDLVLADVVMPGMSGVDMVTRLRELRRDMRVLWISGYTDERVEERGLDSSSRRLLRKPFTPETLTARVREALDH